MFQNHYDILGVQRSATKVEIKNRFFELSKQLHPDKNGDLERYQQVTHAYTVLSNDSERRKFDLQLGPIEPNFTKTGFKHHRSWEQSSNFGYTQRYAHRSRTSSTLDPLKPNFNRSVSHFNKEQHAHKHQKYAEYRKTKEKVEIIRERGKGRALGWICVGVGFVYVLLR